MNDKQFGLLVGIVLLTMGVSFAYSMAKTPKELRHGVMPGIARMGDEIEMRAYENFKSVYNRLDVLENKVKSIDCIDYCIDNFARPIPNIY